jgi:hypothetical protein
MKFKLRIIFLFVLTLVLIPGFVWILFTGKIAQALTPGSSDSLIYAEGISNQWQNWSWNTNIDFNSTENPKSGSKTIAATMNGWGGVYLHTDTAIDPSTSESIIFSLRPTRADTNFVVLLYDENNQAISSPQTITNYGEAPAANVWKTYVVSLSANRQVKGIAIQDISGMNDNKVFIDDYFVKKKPTAPPTPVLSGPAANGTIYSEGLTSGWENWSWGSSLNFDNGSPVVSGRKSLTFTTLSPWAGLYLHSNGVIDTSSFSNLQFSLYASQTNQKFAVTLVSENNQMTVSPLTLDQFGTPVQGAWKTYTIPLATLNAANKRINGIILQEVKGQSQPTVVIDDIAFISGGAGGINPAQPSIVPTATVAPTNAPTPTPTAKPIRRFTTLAPRAALPSSAECAALVRRSPWEPRPENTQANNTKGIQLTTRIDGANAEGNQRFLPRINGDFTGTTDEIIQWGACKWGLDEDIVRAVAAQESWWRQSTQGDFNGTDYESYGLLQVRRTYHEGTYPTSVYSVPFNVDYALAWRRACMEGYFNWIPAEAKGNEWGCVGLWFSGRWFDGDPNVSHSGANWYIGKVKGYLETKPWLSPDFVGSSQ